jgi:hypothetical protein
MRESRIESYLSDEVKKREGLCLKWVCPNFIGVPDRIVFIYRQIWFVEVKSETGKRSPIQIYVGKLIMKYTDNYLVISSKEQVDEFIRKVNEHI